MSEIKQLHEPFARFLRESGIPFVRARSDQRSTVQVGWPDFTLVLNSCAILIEFKTKDGRISPDQRRVIAELAKAGTRVHVLRDLPAAIALVQEWRGTAQSSAEAEPAPTSRERGVCGAPGRTYVAMWTGCPMVFRRDGGGHCRLLRKATAQDIASLPGKDG